MKNWLNDFPLRYITVVYSLTTISLFLASIFIAPNLFQALGIAFAVVSAIMWAPEPFIWFSEHPIRWRRRRRRVRR